LEYARKALLHRADQADLNQEMEKCLYQARQAYQSYMQDVEDERTVETLPTLSEGLEIAESRLENLKTGYGIKGQHYDDIQYEDQLVEDLQKFVENYRKLAEHLEPDLSQTQ